MSTVTAPTPAAVPDPATPPPAPTAPPRQFRWLLRLHRPALYAWTGLVVALAALLLWLGGPLTDASAAGWQQYDACGMDVACAYDQEAILLYKDVSLYTSFAVLAVPFLVAAWAGASLIGRELESGTARLAWTQGVTPTRWLAAKLALPAALITTGTALAALLHHLAWSAGRGRVDNAKPWYSVESLYASGPMVVALALAGLAAGALLGLLLRRSLAALIGAVCATGVLWIATFLALPHLWPTATHVSSLRDGPSGSGMGVAEGLLTADGDRLDIPRYCGSSIDPSCGTLFDRLDAVSFYKDYHPESHYWPLQLMATAVLLAVTALLTVLAFRVLRHRTGVRKGAAV
ncbi:ABC transporter permease subunit [Streptomyces sp. NPDC058676]|uniref:ABC transporter permease subunit n=1 Tax=unclassified Streptomyces TaxID=2593676 RepID=UPI003668C54D